MEHMGDALRGMYRDTLFNAENRLVFDSGWTSNTIVESCRTLLAALMKGEPNIGGIGWMMVGKGSEDWTTDPQPPATTVTGLAQPYPDKIKIEPAKAISFLDEQDNITDLPTRKLEIRAVLGQDFPEAGKTSELREFGLFSKDLRMINCVRHPIIQKAASETLIRVVRLIF